MQQNFCDSCGEKLIPGRGFCPQCGRCISAVAPGAPAVPGKNPYPNAAPGNRIRSIKEYKVIELNDVWNLGSGGRFDTAIIEKRLNSYGLDGWSLKESASRQIPGLGTLSHQFIIILEREIPLQS